MINYTTFKHPTDEKTITFYTPTEFCEWRINGMLTKEPITIEWINSFNPTDIFWDIGANIGVYTMYAAVYKKCQVYAFEPVLLNIGVLTQTVIDNNAYNVKLFPVAVNDKTGISNIAVYNITNGYGGHTVDQHNGNMNQGVYSVTIDDLVKQGLPIPTHLKIDVDGIEHLIIQGGLNTIPKIKTILIEVDLLDQKHIEMVGLIQSLGFIYSELQVEQAKRFSKSNQQLYAEHLFYKP